MGADARTVHVTVPAAEAELASDALWGAGAAAVEERAGAGGPDPVVLVAGPGAGGDVGALVAAVAGRWRVEVVPVDLRAALDAWRDHARAVRVGPLVVRPPWVPAPAGGEALLDVVVDPGRVFGSGAHESTRLALAAVADVVRGGERVLDLGCGSGVLAVAALRLGAASAVGVDTDPQAVAATRENAARNGVADRLVAHVADAAATGRLVGAGSCDLVVANLLLPDLVAAVPEAARAVTPGGVVVAAGVLAEQLPALVAAVPGGLRAEGPPRTTGPWAALALRAARGRPEPRV